MSLIPPQDASAGVQPVLKPGQTPSYAPTPPPTNTPTTPTSTATTTPLPDKLAAATNAAPTLEPSSILGVAQSATTAQDAAMRAQIVTAQTQAQKMGKMLSNQSVDWQASYWKNLSDATKSLLLQAGYQAPDPSVVHPNATQGGFWHDLIHQADNVRHGVSAAFDVNRHIAGDAEVVANDALIKGPSTAFNEAMAPVAQGMRAFDLNAQNTLDTAGAQTNPIARAEGLLNILDPASTLHDWSAVSNGAASFQPNSIMYVKDYMGINGPTLQLAKIVAANGATNDLATALKAGLASVPPADRPSASNLILSNPKFMDAVQLLANSHLDIGSALFGGLSPSQLAKVEPGTRVGAIEGVRGSLDVAAGAAAGLGVLTGGAAALGARAGAASLAADGTLAAGAGDAASVSAIDSLGTVKGLTAASIPVGAGLSALRAGSNQTPDQATAISPFGIKVNPMSGIVDGLVSWYANPLFAAGNFNAGFKAAKYSATVLDSMGAGRDVEAFYNNVAGGQRKAQQFADAVTKPWEPGTTEQFAKTPNFAQLDAIGFKSAGMENDVKAMYPELLKAAQEGEPTVPVVARYFASDQAMINLMRGKAGGLYKNDVLLPYLSLPKSLLDDLRGVGSTVFQGKRFNPGAMSLNQLSTAAFGQAAKDAIEAEKLDGANVGIVARYGRRFSNLTPPRVIDLTAPDSAVNIQRLARMLSLPEDKVTQFRNAWSMIDPADINMKDDILRAIYEDGFTASHLDRNPRGLAYMEELRHSEVYSFGKNAEYKNPMNADAPPQDNAILPSQLSNQRALPNFSEWYKFGKKNVLMSGLQMGLNQDLFDKFMQRYWKMAVLLRPGFALRFAGEEGLNFILRNGGGAYVQGRVASSLENTANATRERRLAGVLAQAKEEAAKLGLDPEAPIDPAILNHMDAGRMYHALSSHIPEEAQRMIKTRGEWIASMQGWHAVQWARKIGIRMVPEEILKGAKNLSERGVLDSPIEEHVDAVSGRGSTYMGDLSKAEKEVPINTPEGTPVSISRVGKYRSYGRENQDFIDPLSFHLSGIAQDPLGSSVARAFTNGGRDAQYQAAMDWITARKIEVKLADAKAAHNEELTTALQKRLDYHNNVELPQFRVAYKTKTGGTIANGMATQEQINHDWAEAVVNHVNHFTMTGEGQTFKTAEGKVVDRLKKGEEGERIPIEGLQPIRLGKTTEPRTPWQIATRDEGRPISPVDTKEPYKNIPAGHVRLFRGENTTTVQEGLPKLANPGRTWFTHFQDAMNRAGADGQVYKIDVPTADMAKYDAHTQGTLDLNALQTAQKAARKDGGAGLTRGDHFESGDVAHTAEGENAPSLLIDRLGQGLTPNNVELERVDRIHWPAELLAPEMIAKVDNRGLIGRIMEYGMRQVVGRPANWLSRQPIFTYNYAVALDQSEKFLAVRGIADESGDLAHDIAMDRAFNMTMPYIHDPQARSQFSVITRNLWPFWFAQEQFYKRWGRLFGTYPEAWYKLSLTMNGLKSVGFVAKDAYGKDAFTYPGSQAVLSMLAKFPFNGSIPVGVSFTGEVSQLNPTLTTGGAPWPSFGPLATVPMSIIGGIFPHLEPFAQGILGPQAPPERNGDWATQVIDQMIPSIAARLSAWYAEPSGGTATSPGNVNTNLGSALFMSSMIQAGQQLEASGHSLTALQQTNLHDIQMYLDRLGNWTKNLILMRAVFGLLAPASPTIKIADHGDGAILTALMSEMPYEEAVTAFVKAHPNATAMTTFETTTSGSQQSGAYVPATVQAAHFINDNSAFFENYPALAPWAIPAAAATGTFNASTYQQELGLSLRVRRNLNDWYQAAKYSEGAQIYYPLETAMLAAGGDPASLTTLNISLAQAQANVGMTGASKAQVEAAWSSWKVNFDKMHPIFAEQVAQKGTESAARRINIVQSLQNAILDNALPKTDWSSQVTDLMVAYDKVQSSYVGIDGQPGTKGTSAATANKLAFLQWANLYIQAYPSVAPFYNGVIAKAVPG